MNAKLISQEEAKQALIERGETYTVSMFATSGECHVARVVAFECASIVANMLPVGNDPVVRCKNCKHWGSGYIGETEYHKECKLAHYIIGENGYCLYGEVKDGRSDQ